MHTPLTILLVGSATAFAPEISASGLKVWCARALDDARRQVAAACPDAIVLPLPDDTHLRQAQSWRWMHRELVILACVPRSLTAVRRAMAAGVTDYLLEPVDAFAVRARLDTLEHHKQGRQRFSLGDRLVDLHAGTVTESSGMVHTLTTLECRFLGHLAERSGETVSNGELLRAVWGHAGAVRTRSVTHLVSRLRRKLEVNPRRPDFLKTRRGEGVQLDVPAADALRRAEFVGRRAEVEALSTVAARQPILLFGPAGVGKSRLAAEVIGRLDVPVVRIQLEDVHTHARRLQRLATHLEAAREQRSSEALLQALERLGAVCLWIDGLNTDLEPVLTLLVRLAAQCPEAHIVVTSQRDAAVHGLHRARVQPLARRAAVELFLTEARRWDARLGADAPMQARRIVAALDCMPLSVKLAAGQLGLLGLSQLAELVERRIERGVGVPGIEDPRLQVSIARAFEGLSPAAEAVLGVLARLQGSTPVQVLDAVLDRLPGSTLADTVIELQRRALLEPSPERSRYGLLEMIRCYARTRPLDAALWHRAVDALLSQSELQVARLTGPEPRAAHLWLVDSLTALQAVRDQTDGDRHARALLAMGALFLSHDVPVDHIDALRAARQSASPPIAEALARHEAELLVDDMRCDEALALCDTFGTSTSPRRAAFWVLRADAFKQLARFDAAIEAVEAGLEHATATGDLISRSRLLACLSTVERRLGRHADAQVILLRALDAAHRSQSAWDTLNVQHAIAVCHYEQGRMQAAEEGFDLCARGFENMGQRLLSARARTNRASALSMLGEIDEAEQLLGPVRTTFGKHAPRLGDATVLLILARLQVDRGDLVAARATLVDALDASRDVVPRTAGYCMLWLGVVAVLGGHPARAEPHYAAAIELGVERGLVRMLAMARYFASLTGEPAAPMETPWYPTLAEALNRLRAEGPAAAEAPAVAAVLAQSVEARAALRILQQRTV